MSNSSSEPLIKLASALKELQRNDLEQDMWGFNRENYKCMDVLEQAVTVRDADLTKISKELTSVCYRLGRYLGVPQRHISQIREDNVGKITQQALRILQYWKKSKKEQATRQFLCNGLVYIGQQNLVERLQKQWGSKGKRYSVRFSATKHRDSD